MPDAGWLDRQLTAIKRESKLWPDWMKGELVDASEKKKADARFGGDLVDALNMSKHEPLTDDQLREARDLATALADASRSGLPCDQIDSLVLQLVHDYDAGDVIAGLVGEVAFQRGFANELIAMTVSSQGGSHGAAREIRARLDGARENERLQVELDSIIEVCANAGIGEAGQSALDRVKELHKSLGEQIDAANSGSNA